MAAAARGSREHYHLHFIKLKLNTDWISVTHYINISLNNDHWPRKRKKTLKFFWKFENVMRPNFFGLERQNFNIEKFTNSDSSEKPDRKSFLEYRILKN